MESEIASEVKLKIENGDWKQEETGTKISNDDWEVFLAKELEPVQNPRLFLYELIHESGIDWLPSPFSVLTAFQSWFNKQEEPGSIGKDQFATILFKFYDYKANNVTAIIFDIFGAKDRSQDENIEAIKELLSQGKIDYDKVAKMVIYLNLRDKFEFKEVVFPWMLSNASANDLVKYLKPDKDHFDLEDQAKKLIKWLDDFKPNSGSETEANVEFKDKCRRFNINRLKDNKQRDKLLQGLVKDLDMSLETDAPNSFHHQVGNHLQWLIREKLGEMDRVTWRDNVRDKVQKYPKIHPKLVNMLAKKDHLDEALFWVKEYDIDLTKLDPDVKTKVETAINTGVKPPDEKEADQKSKENHHQLNISEDKVVFIDAPEGPQSLQEVMDHLENKYIMGLDVEFGTVANRPIIGLDCEFGSDTNNVSKAVLMQIACKDKIYLIDLISEKIKDDHWTDFLEKLFGVHHLFLGYDFRSDLTALSKTSHVFENLKELMSGKLLDMKIFSDRAFNEDLIPGLPKKEDGKYKGLTGLTERVLGKPLNKGQQMSVWTNRPLRQAQIVYAAIDAFVLIELYQELYEKCGSNKEDLQTLESNLLKGNNKAPSKTPKKSKNQQAESNDDEEIQADVSNNEQINPPQFKVVTDGMLEVDPPELNKNKRSRISNFLRKFKCISPMEE